MAGSAKAEREILAFVRTGVEEFILNKVTVGDFLKAIRAVGENEEVYSHQLTQHVFSAIVKDAIRKRNLKQLK